MVVNSDEKTAEYSVARSVVCWAASTDAWLVVHLAVHWVDSMVGDSVALWVLNWADTMAAPMVVDLDVRTVASLAARSAG